MTLLSKSFKQEYSLEKRKLISSKIRNRYKDRLPIIVERLPNSNVPDITKKKFLAPAKMSNSELFLEIRKHLDDSKQSSEQTAIFLFVSKNNLTSSSQTLSPSSQPLSMTYEKFKDDDGFLYLTYSGENTFGSDN